MRCRYCRDGTNLIEAHVIPEGFYRPFRQAGQAPRLLSSNDYPRRIPIGVYDSTILCAQCEPRFGPWDQYAQELLRDDPMHATIHRVGDRIVGYEIAEWRYDLLKLFFISLLWRATVSTHPVFQRIKLGPFEDVALRMLREGTPGSAQDFGVALAKFDTRNGRAILDPHLERIEGINYARFYLGLYVAYIKVDSRESPEWVRPFLLAPGGPLKIIGRDLKEGRELAVLRGILNKPQNRRRTASRRR